MHMKPIKRYLQTFRRICKGFSQASNISFLSACFVSMFGICCPAAERFFATSASENGSGLFCMYSKTETNTQVRLFKIDGKAELLFAKAIEGGIEPPICLSNSVIVLNAYGVVRKFDLNGNLLFETVPSGISGSFRLSG